MKSPYKHVQTYTINGTTYRYYREPGSKRVRLEGEPGTTKFAKSYETASNPKKVNSATCAKLLSDYFGSVEFNRKAERTKKDYLQNRKLIEVKWSHVEIRALEDKRIRGKFIEWHLQLIEEIGARQADLVLATMRVVLSYGIYSSILSHNHLLGFKSAYRSDRSDKIWTKDDVEAFMRDAPRDFQLAVILALNTGRRESDLIRLTWQDYDGETIAVMNQKSGRKGKFKARCTAALRTGLDAYKLSLKDVSGNSRVPAPNETILTTPTGKAWTQKHFCTKFAKAKNGVGLTELHFHDLRGTAITVLAERSCTHAEIASISGHAQKHIEKVLDTYMPITRATNEAATAKMEESWIASVSRLE